MRRLRKFIGWTIGTGALVLGFSKAIADWVGRSTLLEDASGLGAKMTPVLEFFQRQPDVWFYGFQTILIAIGLVLIFWGRISSATHEFLGRTVDVRFGPWSAWRALPIIQNWGDVLPPDYLVTFVVSIDPITITNKSKTDRVVLHFSLNNSVEGSHIRFGLLSEHRLAREATKSFREGEIISPLSLEPQHSLTGTLSFASSFATERDFEGFRGDGIYLIVKDVVSDTEQAIPLKRPS